MGGIRIISRWSLAIGVFLAGWAADLEIAAAQAVNWRKNYQVFAFNDLGMHCYDRDFSVFAILPPFHVLHSQVVYKGLKPWFLADGQINLVYSGRADKTGGRLAEMTLKVALPR